MVSMEVYVKSPHEMDILEDHFLEYFCQLRLVEFAKGFVYSESLHRILANCGSYR